MNMNNNLASLGAAIATSSAAKRLSRLQFADVLHAVGLERHRSRTLENIGLVAVGACVGVGMALLFAPAPGQQTRQRLGRKLNELGTAAKNELPDVLSRLDPSERRETEIGQA